MDRKSSHPRPSHEFPTQTIRKPEEINRREFLTLCALGALPTALSACRADQANAGSAQPSPTKSLSPASPTLTLTPTSADWTTLAKSIQGTVIRPGSDQYPTALRLFDPRFDNILPAAIIYCASPTDIQTCLAFAHRFNLPVAPRAGGHSYAGYSTTSGLVLDITRMNAVSVNAGAGTATIGAGARLIDVYATLAQQNLTIPAGSCATVGIAGLTLGGGVGVLGRKFGLTCDNLLSAQVILADGRLLSCDPNSNADLFWALRGGGGGNFGIVTSFTFRTHPVTTLALFTLSWSWSNAAAVVDAWQHWAPYTPDEVWSNCLLLTTTDKQANPIVRVNGVYVGNTTSLQPLLQQLINQVGVAPTNSYVTNSPLLDTMLYEAGCYGKSVNECHLPTQNPQGQLQRVISGAKSDYFTTPIARSGINALVNAIAHRQHDPTSGGSGIGLDAYGGAINRVAADATAFVHRNALFSAQYTVNWDVGSPNSVVTANRAWLDQTWQAMRPYASGTAYQNYIDPELANWQQAYYGANLPRLQHIKALYDPNNFFHFAQSIAPTSGQ